MNFRKVLKKERKKYELLLGYDNKEKDLVIDLDKNPSIIITGETGAGKSILLDQILCELISSNTSNEFAILPIDTSGVELSYYRGSRYNLISAINDEEKSIRALAKILREIDRRKELFNSQNVKNIDKYNEKAKSKLPRILVAIDDDKSLLKNQDLEKMLYGIISQIKDTGIYFVLTTNDIYNKFFEKDLNVYATVRISFDLADKENADIVNIEDADNLEIGYFIVEYNNKKNIYQTYGFDDHIITEILSR